MKLKKLKEAISLNDLNLFVGYIQWNPESEKGKGILVGHAYRINDVHLKTYSTIVKPDMMCWYANLWSEMTCYISCM